MEYTKAYSIAFVCAKNAALTGAMEGCGGECILCVKLNQAKKLKSSH